MDILGQTSLLVGITSFALGASVLARNVRNKVFIAFAVVCTVVSAWALTFFVDEIFRAPFFYRLHLVLNVWLAPTTLAFIQIMIRMRDRVSRWLLEASIFLAPALTICVVLQFDRYDPVLQAIYFAPALIVLQLLQLMRIDRKIKRGDKVEPKTPAVGIGRRTPIYLGGLGVLMTCVMDHVPWTGSVIPAIGNLALTVYLFFVSQAITRQRLLHFSSLISRFLVVMAVALVLTFLYSVLVSWIQNSPGLFFLNSFIVSFLILMLLDPLRSLMTYFTQRLLTQEHRRLAETLRNAQLRLAAVVTPPGLFDVLLLTVRQTLDPERAAIYVLQSDGIKYRLVREEAAGPLPERSVQEFLSSHSLLQYCQRLRSRGELPVVLDQVLENEIDRTTSRSQREQLQSLLQALKAVRCNLLIPLFHGNALLAFVILDAPSPPESWGTSWGLLSVVYPFFEQAAETLINMEVFVRQREKERLAAIGEMAAGLAHEIRNPLGSIKGAAQYLDPSANRPESRFLKVIVEEVDRLNRVVTQFLEYSKPSNPELRTINVSRLVEKTIENLRPSLREEIQLNFNPGEDRVEVLGSAEQLQQVLINLLQNSFRALEQKPGGQVSVMVESGPGSTGSEVRLIVQDDGPGIKKEHLDKLFIPFFTTSPSGTGLGLSICQKIIEAHRGRIEVFSEEGKLTRFAVVLPQEAE